MLEPSSSPLLHIPAVQLEMDALVEKYGEGESEEESANSTNQDKCLTIRRHTVGPANSTHHQVSSQWRRRQYMEVTVYFYWLKQHRTSYYIIEIREFIKLVCALEDLLSYRTLKTVNVIKVSYGNLIAL